jgi:hypothetical protein
LPLLVGLVMPVNWKRLFQLITISLGVGLLLDLLSRLGAEMLWFQEVDYLSVFQLKFQVRLILLIIVTGVTAFYLLGNLTLAQRLKYPHGFSESCQSEKLRKPPLFSAKLDPSLWVPPSISSSASLRLRSLLPLTIGLSVLIGFLLLYYGHLAVSYWQDGATLSAPFASRFNARTLWQTAAQLASQVWLLGGVLGIASILLIHSRFLLRAYPNNPAPLIAMSPQAK